MKGKLFANGFGLWAGLMMMTVTAAACGGNKGPDPAFVAGEAARRVVLADIADGVVLPTLREFATRATALVAAADDLVGAPLDNGRRTSARAAWSAAMDTWQEAEVFQLGPAGARTAVAGGQDLRDRIYSWPIVNPCRIDQESVAQSFNDATALGSAPANIRGLDALEYLLFKTTSDNGCPINAQINTSGSWAALGEEGVFTRRAAHAAALARDLAASAAALRDAWETTGGNFRNDLASAGESGVYATAQEALNNLSDAIFYIDKEVKDLKIGTPLGYFDCSTDICPERFESRLSARAKANLEANLRGFRRIFAGADTTAAARATPRHFYALLVAAGAGALGDAMLDGVDRSEAALAAITTDLESAIQNDLASVEAIFGAVKGLTDLLKTQFVSTLDLELPRRAEGDND